MRKNKNKKTHPQATPRITIGDTKAEQKLMIGS